MKRIIGMIFIIFSLTSCEQSWDALTGQDVFDHIKEPTMHFSSGTEAWVWVSQNIAYGSSGSYEWQSPRQTEDRRMGICVDYCILLMWHLDELGYDVFMRGITEWNGVRHSILVVNGKEIEVQGGVYRTWGYENVIGEWDLEEALDIVYYEYGNRAIDTIRFD